jgi:hypothetical protein
VPTRRRLKKPSGTAKSLDAVSKLLKAKCTKDVMIENSNGDSVRSCVVRQTRV